MLRQLRVTIEGHAYEVTVEDLTDTGNQLYPDHRSMVPTNATAPVMAPTTTRTETPSAPAPASGSPAPVASSGGTAVLAPMSGVVHEISVSVGDSVDAGQVVAVMEAMKLKSPIVVDKAGTVGEVLVAAGDAVEAGATILTLA